MANLPTTLTPLIEGYSESDTKRILRAQFGDGYSQRVVDGINNTTRTISITFRGTLANVLVYRDFFRDLGADSFTWTPPTESSAMKFSCEGYSFSTTGRISEVSATIKQEFDL